MFKIKPKKRNLSKVLKLTATVFAFPSLYMGWLMINDLASTGIWLGVFAFTCCSTLLCLIGKYQEKKYARLGNTILFLESQKIVLGSNVSGKIKINHPNFTKVDEIFLTNMVYYSGNYNNRCEVLETVSVGCNLSFANEVTWIHFRINVPPSGRKTSRFLPKFLY